MTSDFFQKAYALEKAGKLDEARQVYWQSINEGFYGSFPFERIIIMAAKRRDYEECITACKKYISIPHTESGVERKIRRMEALIVKYERMLSKETVPTTDGIVAGIRSKASQLARDRFTNALPSLQSRHEVPEWAREVSLIQINDVPPLEMFYPQYGNLDRKQQTFYDDFRQHFLNRTPIDVKGNISYLFLYAYEVIGRLKSDPHESIEQLRALQHVYGREETFARYLTLWIFDAFTYSKAYYEALAYVQLRLGSESLMFTSRVLSLKYHLGVPISGSEVYSLCRTDSRIVKSNKDVCIDLLENSIRTFETAHGIDFLSVLTEQFALRTKDNYLFAGVPTGPYSLDLPHYDYAVIGDIAYLLQDWMRVAENSIRMQKGLPKIGEGWISETMLFNIVADICKEKGYDVIHHHYPPFLHRQELDIYIPDLKHGIEYMGEQHYKPVAIFGGEEGLKSTIERDQRKKILCEQNGIELTYVKYDEGLDEKYIRSRIGI